MAGKKLLLVFITMMIVGIALYMLVHLGDFNENVLGVTQATLPTP